LERIFEKTLSISGNRQFAAEIQPLLLSKENTFHHLTLVCGCCGGISADFCEGGLASVRITFAGEGSVVSSEKGALSRLVVEYRTAIE
jgi:hypothetical protein